MPALSRKVAVGSPNNLTAHSELAAEVPKDAPKPFASARRKPDDFVARQRFNGSAPDKAAEYLDLMRELARSPDAEIASRAAFFLEGSV